MSALFTTEKISFTLHLLSGLHIGAGNESFKIGGIDSPVIKNPITNEPYIPGSSLKGKLRCLLEQEKNVELGQDDTINNFFGMGAGRNKKGGITKILVRDLQMTKEWEEKFKEFTRKGKQFFEEKTEIVIDRKTGSAKNGGLRNIERVPAGIAFDGSIVLRCTSETEKKEMTEMLKKAFDHLENDALGGSGSRGYGAVRIEHSL